MCTSSHDDHISGKSLTLAVTHDSHSIINIGKSPTAHMKQSLHVFWELASDTKQTESGGSPERTYGAFQTQPFSSVIDNSIYNLDI